MRLVTYRANFAVALGMLAGLAAISGCAMMGGGETAFMYKDLPVAKGSATAGDGNSVTFKGTPLALAGPGIKVGEPLRNVQVAKGDLSLTNIADKKGKVRIISIVPS